MKSRIICIALITAILVSAFIAFADAPFLDVLATPAVKSPLAAKSLLVGVTLAGKRIVEVGWRGHIVYSDDQGKSWKQADVPVNCDLVAVHFPTPQKGWAVGHDGVVLHSADAGATWVKQFDGRAAAQVMESYYRGTTKCSGCHSTQVPPTVAKNNGGEPTGLMEEIKKISNQGPDKPFLDVWFENEKTGYIVGAFSMIFRTDNGGKSWVPLYNLIDNPKRYHLYSIRPIGGELFLTAEQGIVFKLDRKKGRFEAIKTPYVGTFFGVIGKPGAVIAFGMRGNAFRSTDSGKIWQKVETGAQGGLTGGVVTDNGRMILVSQGGQLFVSSDDGASFSQVKINQPAPATGVAAIGGNLLALSGQRGAQIQSIK